MARSCVLSTALYSNDLQTRCPVLSTFAGGLFRRYSADFVPLLKYVNHQLYQGQTSEIVILRQFVWKMAGIEPLPNMNESQITAMAGGPALRIEAIASAERGARANPKEANKSGGPRLGRMLMDNDLALPLLVQVAQQRQACLFKAPNTHLKALSGLFDTVRIES